MEELEPLIKDLCAPGLLTRATANMIINQALCDVGREGWLTVADRLYYFGYYKDGAWRFNTPIFEDLKLRFEEDCIRKLENMAALSNPFTTETQSSRV